MEGAGHRLQRVVGVEGVALGGTKRDLSTGVEVDAGAGWDIDGERTAARQRHVRHRPGVERIRARCTGAADDEAVTEGPAPTIVDASEPGDDHTTATAGDGVDRLACVDR